MWRIALLLMLPPLLAQEPQGPATSTCVRCHLDLDGELQRPAQLFSNDIHASRGLSCDSCHGGDPAVGVDQGGPEDSMSRAKGYVGIPDRRKIAALCASCHSKLDYMRQFNPQARVDQYTEYLTSVHGKLYIKGDRNVATCSDCHGAHGIRAVHDPNSSVYPTNVAATCGRCHADKDRMGPYRIPTNQLELYSTSVHGEALIKNRDLAAPTCNDCHGNHGANPPGVDSVANVCGQCHASQWELFGQSPHKRAFAENDLPGCVTCHEHHGIVPTSDAMIGVGPDATCATCHEEGSAGYQAAATMREGLDQLKQHLDLARQLLQRAERAGMEVSQPVYRLTEGRDRLVRARVSIHRFDPQVLAKWIGEGQTIAASCESSGKQALADLAFRRKGLAVSALILVSMIGLLLLKIRQIGT